MNRTFWNAAHRCGLAICLSFIGLHTSGLAMGDEPVSPAAPAAADGGQPDQASEAPSQRGAQEKSDRGQGAQPGKGQGAQPGKGQGAQPGKGQGAQPGKGQGAQPGKGQGAQPGRGQGAQPGRGQGAQPGTGQGAQPGRGQGAQPGKGQGAQPGRGQGAQPGRGQGAQPGRGQGAESPQGTQGGQTPRVGGRSGIHAPSLTGPRRSTGSGGPPPSIHRTPTFTRPNSGPGSGATTRPPMTARPSGHPRPGMRDGFDRSGDARRDDIRRGNDGFDRSGDARRDDFRRGSDDSDRSGDAQRDDFRRGNDDPDRSGDRQRDDFRRGNLGSDRSGDAQRYDFRRGTNDGRDVYGDRFRARRYDNTPSRIVDRPFIGNSIEFNDRRFNLGSSNYQPSYYRHSGYHGYWNGNRGFGLGSANNYGYGSSYGPGWGWGFGNRYQYDSRNQGFGYRPLGWGLGGWGLGSLIYRSGYLGYSNPYYVGGGTTVYNYSQPIPVTYGTQEEIIQDDPNSPDSVLNDAVAAFQRNDYDAALDIVNKGIAQYPDDAVLHEFRSLVLFARQDYQQSASTIHAVLAVGPGWDWTTLSSMYASVPLYTEHLRALEAFTKANPQDAASRFLLAYHYLTCGHTDAAARQLQQVVTLLPNDRVAADVLKLVSAPLADEPGEIAEAPLSRDAREPTERSVQSVDPETLVGTWKASREDGSLFKLTLTDDARFTWTFNEEGQAAQTFEGTYSVEGDVLVLERQDGGSLIAAVAPSSDKQFNFKLLGAPEDDPGLSFSR